MTRTFHAATPLQALILEHALAMARQLERAATDASDGKVLAALQAQAETAEKRGRPPAPARAAARRPGPSVAPPATS